MGAQRRSLGHVSRCAQGRGYDLLRPQTFAKLRAGRVPAFAGPARYDYVTRGADAMTDRRISTHRAPRGFTLIEMMLAISVLALILTMLASAFSTIAHSKVHAEGRLMVDREGRALLWQLTKELRNAVQTPYAASNVALLGNGRMGRGLPIDTITLSTFSGGHRRAVTGLTPETIVTYNLTPNPDQQGWYMLQRSQQSGLLTNTVAQQTTVLADNILSLHLRY